MEGFIDFAVNVLGALSVLAIIAIVGLYFFFL